MWDVLTERVALKRRSERLNGGKPQPLGTLARAVLEYPHVPPWAEYRSENFRRRWKLYTNPAQDVKRLLTIAGRELAAIKPHGLHRVLRHFERYSLASRSVRALAERQLPLVRKIVEKVMKIPFDDNAPTLADYVEAMRETILWLGCNKTTDFFQVTPAGAVLLSAYYGYRRSGLGVCSSCGKFMIVRRRGFIQKRCDKCRTLTSRRPDRASGLPVYKTKRWQKMLQRMRRRGFKRIGLNTREQRQEWKETALRALFMIKREEVDAWEDAFAPKGKPGRPGRGQTDSTIRSEATTTKR